MAAYLNVQFNTNLSNPITPASIPYNYCYEQVDGKLGTF